MEKNWYARRNMIGQQPR